MGMLRDRLALAFSDGSMTVLPPQADIGWARREALSCDQNQDQPDKFTRIARVRVELVETIETPSAAPVARIARRESCRA